MALSLIRFGLMFTELVGRSHYSAQYANGVFGPIIIHGPAHAEYDYDLGPVMVVCYQIYA